MVGPAGRATPRACAGPAAAETCSPPGGRHAAHQASPSPLGLECARSARAGSRSLRACVGTRPRRPGAEVRRAQ
eukprot:7045603-Alexandrium_andersonii.AAC.1